MKITVTWDGADVQMGRKVKDPAGCKCVIISTIETVRCPWSIVRLADGFFYEPMALSDMVSRLNTGRFTPEEFE